MTPVNNRKGEVGDSEFERWWDKTWRERHEQLERLFGPTDPPDMVTSFSWSDPRKVIPGACAMAFPSRHGEGQRADWLYITHGLTQPRGPGEVLAAGLAGRTESGYGWEFGILVREPAKWPSSALYWLLTYLMDEGVNRIEPGHRVPIGFTIANDGTLAPVLFPQRDSQIEGDAGALLFWPYMHLGARLATSTGSFGILVATYITAEEYALAKQTTSTHVLLLLKRAGIGQRSVPLRATVTDDPRWAGEWRRIARLDETAARRELG